MKSQRLQMTLPLARRVRPGRSTTGDAYTEWAARGGHAVTPDSSIEQPEHVGHRAHTNFKTFVPPPAWPLDRTRPTRRRRPAVRHSGDISTRLRLRSPVSINLLPPQTRTATPTPRPPIPRVVRGPSRSSTPTTIRRQPAIWRASRPSSDYLRPIFKSSSPTDGSPRSTPIGISRRRSTSSGHMPWRRSQNPFGRGSFAQLRQSVRAPSWSPITS